MNRFVLRCIVRVQQLPFTPYVMLFLLLFLLVGLPYSPVDYLKGDWIETAAHNPLLTFVLTCIVAPLVLSLIFLFAPNVNHSTPNSLKSKRTAGAPALVFAIITFSTSGHILNSMVMGVVLCLCYYGYCKQGKKAAYWAVTTVLILRNLLVYLYILCADNVQGSFVLTLIKNL
ncbi:hypothetical protein [Acetobacteroides hydrogenigenes]|uniref:Uncharacterized protein n=1 Tax=Acetobacteroides hydrogenigenes TaxID=979970 RepID=A0A4R2EC82_9BACT|nr:hypothetical protein [Acetobacteroides hydrogenigenes]TCN66448.1 hypothetical protein CLV25_10977 [Acetobacteroides hydrogenigenes]